jgi:NAD-dependent DNA ligase
VETSAQLAETQWDALNLLKEMGFSVNDDNRKFDSFEDALDYATRYRFFLRRLFFTSMLFWRRFVDWGWIFFY